MSSLRIAACAAGAAVALAAVWVFYLNPLLAVPFPSLAWMATNPQPFAWWPKYLTPSNQAGALAALLAIALFGLAFYRADVPLRKALPESPGFGSASWMSLRESRFARAFPYLLVSCLVVLVYEAMLVLRGGAPRLLLWLGCISLALLAAVSWDWSRRDELKRTAAGLSIALGVFAFFLGVAPAMKLLPQALPLLGAGLSMFVLALVWSRRLGSAVAWWEHLGLLLLALTVETLAMSRAESWRFAMEGDEWLFYLRPRDILLGLLPEFQPLGVYTPLDHLNTNFAHFLIAACMRIAGVSIFGWRLSSVLPFVLSIGPVYYFLRWFSGRRAAALGAVLLASSCLLHNFSLIGYNNTHGLLPLTLGLGAYAFASQGRSLTRYVLAGAAFGLMMLVYAVGRLAAIPMALLFVFVTWRFRAAFLPACVAAGLGFVTVAAPMLFSGTQWHSLLTMTTPIGTPPEGFNKDALAPAQIAENAVDSLFVFLAGGQMSHHIRGPHADPVTGILMLVGYGVLAANVRRNRIARAWLIGMVLFSLAMGAHQHYPYIKNTRLFALVPMNAILAGLGGAALAALLGGGRRLPSIALVALLAIGAAGLNLLHWRRVIEPISGAMPIDHLVRQFEETAAADGGGMRIFVVWDGTGNFALGIARAYGAAVERMVRLHPDELEGFAELAEARTKPAMLLLPSDLPEREKVFDVVESIWPESEREEIRHSAITPVLLYRYLSPAGRREIARPPAERSSLHGQTTVLEVPRPACAAADAEGGVCVLSPRTARAYWFRSGEPVARLKLEPPREWTSVVLLPGGRLAAGALGPESLQWFGRGGELLRSLGYRDGLNLVRSLVPWGNGEMAALTDGGYVVVVSAEGRVARLPAVTDRGLDPTAIAPGPEGTLWIANADGRLIELSPDGRLRAEHPFRPVGPTFAVLPDRSLLYPEIEERRVVHRDLSGRFLHGFSGFARPAFVSLAPGDRLMVADAETSSVVIFPPANVLGLLTESQPVPAVLVQPAGG